MKRAICAGAVVIAATAVAIVRAGQENRSSEPARQLLATYCNNCHSARIHAGGLVLESLSLDAVPEHADVWEKAIRKLRGRQMPPPGSRQPEQRDIDTFVEWMETTLD